MKELDFETLFPYLYSNPKDHIFVYLEYSGLDKERFDEAVKSLPDDMSARVMTLREQWLYQGKEEGMA